MYFSYGGSGKTQKEKVIRASPFSPPFFFVNRFMNFLMNWYGHRHVNLLDMMNWIRYRYMNLFDMVHWYVHRYMYLLNVMNRIGNFFHVMMMNRMNVIRYVNSNMMAEIHTISHYIAVSVTFLINVVPFNTIL